MGEDKQGTTTYMMALPVNVRNVHVHNKIIIHLIINWQYQSMTHSVSVERVPGPGSRGEGRRPTRLLDREIPFSHNTCNYYNMH